MRAPKAYLKQMAAMTPEERAAHEAECARRWEEKRKLLREDMAQHQERVYQIYEQHKAAAEARKAEQAAIEETASRKRTSRRAAAVKTLATLGWLALPGLMLTV